MRLVQFFLTLAAIFFAALMVLPIPIDIPGPLNWRLFGTGIILGLLIAAAAKYISYRYSLTEPPEAPTAAKEDAGRQG